jgi:hypothetical protein
MIDDQIFRRFFFVAFVSFCNQVVKTRVNTGFLEREAGHCQRNCQPNGGLKDNPPQLRDNPAETRLLPLDKPTSSNVSLA